jgi:hypothetical protein
MFSAHGEVSETSIEFRAESEIRKQSPSKRSEERRTGEVPGIRVIRDYVESNVT